LICDDLGFICQLESQQNVRTSLKLYLLEKEREVEERNIELAEISIAMRVLLENREKSRSAKAVCQRRIIAIDKAISRVSRAK
jgi:hypothetical protein